MAAKLDLTGKMESVREYEEKMPVCLRPNAAGRLVIVALNEAGYNLTSVDIVDLIEWLKSNRPELLNV